MTLPTARDDLGSEYTARHSSGSGSEREWDLLITYQPQLASSATRLELQTGQVAYERASPSGLLQRVGVAEAPYRLIVEIPQRARDRA
jgi:hypothetical protein